MHTGHGVHIDYGHLLGTMESTDIICSLADGGLELIAHQRLSLGKLGLRNLKRLRAATINFCGNGTQSLIATLAHTLKNGTHTILNDTIIICGTLHERRPQGTVGGNIGL